jgi:hypothetical protein
MKANVLRHAQRILAAERNVGGRQVAAFPAFTLFDRESPPIWWKSGIARPEWGEIIGIYENQAGSGSHAIIVTGEALVLLDQDGLPAQSLRYTEVDRWDRLSKEPVSETLTVWKKNGDRVDLPFLAREGDVFSFIQFLISAIREHGRR